jgi:hypothetical protein
MKPFFKISRKNPAAILSMLLMIGSALCRLLYYVGRETSTLEFWVYLVNMTVAALLFLIAIFFWGEKYPQLTALPVAMGVVFFLLKSLTFESILHTVLCMLLYVAVLLLYTLTVFGVIPFPYLLYPLFGLPLLVHLLQDACLWLGEERGLPLVERLPEISVLLIMASLLSVSFALKKREVAS